MMDVVGHFDQWNILRQQLDRGRLAQCLLFAGPEGIGKRLMALKLAQYALCEDGGIRPCGGCGSCLRIKNNESESVFQVNPIEQQIRVDQVRQVLHFLELKGFRKLRFVVVDQADAMNIQAANAFLKALEEPPEGTCVILISSFPWMLPATVRSRAVWVTFKPLKLVEIKSLFPKYPDWAVRMSQGSPGRLLTVVESADQGVRQKAWELVKAMLQGRRGEEDWGATINKNNYQSYLSFMLFYLRDLLILKTALPSNSNGNSLAPRKHLGESAHGLIYNVDQISEMEMWVSHLTFPFNEVSYLISWVTALRQNVDPRLALDGLVLARSFQGYSVI
ncbi:MAG: hypothetical protein NZ480_01355 [Bdellovibrionaceae bacterium]|nr:hypothetical protein [Pseudobdellovibrionaceae bacterium]